MLNLCVRSITYEAEGIRSFELVHPLGKDLPPFEAGAHIDVSIPGGFTRQYPCAIPPGSASTTASRCWRIAAGAAARWRCTALRAGDMIEVSEPRNLFPWTAAPATRCCWPAASASRRCWPWPRPCSAAATVSSCITARVRPSARRFANGCRRWRRRTRRSFTTTWATPRAAWTSPPCWRGPNRAASCTSAARRVS